MNPPTQTNENGVELLTRDEAAQLLRVSVKTLRKLVRTGKLRAVRYSPTALLRFREIDLRRFVESRTMSGPVQAGRGERRSIQ